MINILSNTLQTFAKSLHPQKVFLSSTDYHCFNRYKIAELFFVQKNRVSMLILIEMTMLCISIEKEQSLITENVELGQVCYLLTFSY